MPAHGTGRTLLGGKKRNSTASRSTKLSGKQPSGAGGTGGPPGPRSFPAPKRAHPGKNT